MFPKRRKSNFTAKCLNTFVAHCSYKTVLQKQLHTKLREFQYKIRNRILYTNEVFKKVDSPWCYFCVIFFIVQKCVLSGMKAQLC